MRKNKPPKINAVTKDALDRMTLHGCQAEKCAEPFDGTMFFHGRCHVGGKLEISYTHGSGVLKIGCVECSATIADIKVGN